MLICRQMNATSPNQVGLPLAAGEAPSNATMKTTITPAADAVRPLKPSLDHADKATARPLNKAGQFAFDTFTKHGFKFTVDNSTGLTKWTFGDLGSGYTCDAVRLAQGMEFKAAEHAALVAVAEAHKRLIEMVDKLDDTGKFTDWAAMRDEVFYAKEVLANLAAMRGQKGTL